MRISCPQCKSVHELHEAIDSGPDEPKCEVCGLELAPWRGARVYRAELIRPVPSTKD